MSEVLWLAEIVAYTGAGTSTLRYASGRGHVTGPAETPASAFYDARMKQPSLLQQDMYTPGKTGGASRTATGSLVLLNGDGALDALLTYGFDGRQVVIRRGTVGAAYPSGFPVVFTGTMEQAEFSDTEITIRIRDRQAILDVPMQPTKYAGSNSLPSGLEGVATDLKGKPKPLVYGVVSNVPAVCVNTSKLIYQVNDGAVTSIDNVYDRGIALGKTLTIAAGGGSASNNASSHDGVTWGLGPTGGISADCACQNAPSGTLIFGTGSYVYWSTDGDTWSNHQISASFIIAALAYDGTGTYCAFGNNGGTAEFWTASSLGGAWTSRTTTMGAAQCFCGIWDSANSQFIAGGALGKIAASPTGVTWTAQSVGIATGILTISAGSSKVCISASGALLYTSPAGVTGTWTLRTTPTGWTEVWSNVFVNSLFLLGGDHGTLATSPDAISWTN